MNTIHAIGRVGRSELKYTASGAAVLSFSLATNKKYKDKSGDWKERTTWLNCELYGKRAESLNNYVNKGSHLFIDGFLCIDDYEKKDGSKGQWVKVSVDKLEFLNKSDSVRSNGESFTKQKQDMEQMTIVTEPTFTEMDVPF